MTNEITAQKKRIFSEAQINVSAILAGPIPPGILIYKNHMALGQEKRAYISLALTIIFTVILFYLIMNLPESLVDKVPNFVFSSIYAVLTSVYFRAYLKVDINTLVRNGAIKASNWLVAGFGLLGLAANVLLVLALSFSEPIYPGEILEIDGNELYYQESVSVEEATKVATILKTQGLFSPELGNIAMVKKIGDEFFTTIVADQGFWEDEEAMNFFKGFKLLLELEFTEKIHLKLESFNLDGTTKTKIIE